MHKVHTHRRTETCDESDAHDSGNTRPGEEIGVIPALQKKKKNGAHAHAQRRPWLVALAGIHMRKEEYNRLPHTHTHMPAHMGLHLQRRGTRGKAFEKAEVTN